MLLKNQLIIIIKLNYKNVNLPFTIIFNSLTIIENILLIIYTLIKIALLRSIRFYYKYALLCHIIKL